MSDTLNQREQSALKNLLASHLKIDRGKFNLLTVVNGERGYAATFNLFGRDAAAKDFGTHIIVIDRMDGAWEIKYEGKL